MNVRNRHRIALFLGTLVFAAYCAPVCAFDRFESGLRYMAAVSTSAQQKREAAVAQQKADAASRYASDVDFQKMAIITEDALSRGHRILWIHPPQKRPGRVERRDDSQRER